MLLLPSCAGRDYEIFTHPARILDRSPHMSHNKVDKLVKMANQIGTFFAAQKNIDQAALTAEHLSKFWDPRMRDTIIDHVAHGGAVSRPRGGRRREPSREGPQAPRAASLDRHPAAETALRQNPSDPADAIGLHDRHLSLPRRRR